MEGYAGEQGWVQCGAWGILQGVTPILGTGESENLKCLSLFALGYF